MRRAQWMCEDLIGALRIPQEEDEAASDDWHNVQARLDRYSLHIPRTEEEIPALEKEVQQISDILEKIDARMSVKIAKQQDRQADLQLRYIKLRTQRALTDRLAIFIKTMLSTSTRHIADPSISCQRASAEGRELSDTTNTPARSHVASLAQQGQEDVPAISRHGSGQSSRGGGPVMPSQGSAGSVEHSESHNATHVTSQRHAASPVHQHQDEITGEGSVGGRAPRRTAHRHSLDRTAHERSQWAATASGFANELSGGISLHHHTDAISQKVDASLARSYREEVSAARPSGCRAAHRHAPKQAAYQEPRRAALVKQTAGAFDNGPSLHHSADHKSQELNITRLERPYQAGALAAFRVGWQAAMEYRSANKPDHDVSVHHCADDAKLRTPASEQHVLPRTSSFRRRTPDATPSANRPVHLRASLPEQHIPANLNEEYWEAKRRLIRAQHSFDTRDQRREKECATNLRLLQQLDRDAMSPEELDLEWVEHISRLTRRLVAAEEAYKKAKVLAVEGGCAISDTDLSSVFDNQKSAGYAPSFENEVKATAPKEMIEHWRLLITTPPDDPEIGAASEDYFSRGGGEPIACWESASATAEPRHRAKIQAWRQTCVAAGKRPEE
jgi:hypothetical protein